MPTIVRAVYLTKHFRDSEFSCRCRRPECDAKPMNMDFMTMLEAMREAWGKAMLTTSGQRCSVWNTKMGGAPKSQHLEGRAADFWFQDPVELRQFVDLAEKQGFRGIGKGRHLVHIDNRVGEPARWIYRDK